MGLNFELSEEEATGDKLNDEAKIESKCDE
jgi:hypothetical protein